MALTFSVAGDSTKARRGSLHFALKNKTIQTPAFLTYSIRGSVPHLIQDNLKLLRVNWVHVALEHFVEQKEPASFKYPHGLHKYLNMPDQLLFCDVRDAAKFDPVAANTETFVAVDTHGGVRRVSPDVWAQAMEAYRPDCCASPADVIKPTEDIKAKRMKKSVDRTLRWLDACLPKAKELDIPIFAPVVGYDSENERVRSAKASAERDVQGYTLNTFELKENQWVSSIRLSIQHLPGDKPRLAYGLSTPEKILEGVSLGIDLFDNSYAYEMTERGRAILFRFGKDAAGAERSIDLWEETMSQSFDALDPTCDCYSCATPHSRAYIHHLLDAHEMLAPLLLMIHNMSQMEKFMEAIRKSLDENRFETDMKTFLQKYASSASSDYSTAKDTTPVRTL
ncbi:tRNA-guanine(15) transglycosylase-like protein [Dichotomocladium elegans]|nr:tRNA-guanine(15) transglycosylase-like protein [Dichotomocladium elegans]